MLYLVPNNYYLDSWYSGAVAGIANDAEGINLDEVVELSTTVKENPWWSTYHGLTRCWIICNSNNQS